MNYFARNGLYKSCKYITLIHYLTLSNILLKVYNSQQIHNFLLIYQQKKNKKYHVTVVAQFI